MSCKMQSSIKNLNSSTENELIPSASKNKNMNSDFIQHDECKVVNFRIIISFRNVIIPMRITNSRTKTY